MRLFDRDRTGAVVTAQASGLLESASRLLAAAENLEQEWASIASGEKGIVRFGILPMPTRALLADMLSARIDNFPHVRNNVVVAYADQLVHALVSGQIEFFIAAEGRIKPEVHLSSQQLREFLLHWIVHSGHPLTRTHSGCGPFPVLMLARSGLDMLPNMIDSAIGEPQIIDGLNVLVEVALVTDSILQASAYTVTRQLQGGNLNG